MCMCNLCWFQTYQATKGSTREYRLICQGYYPDIHILDATSLELLFTLSSKVAPDWISALCIVKPLKRQGKTSSMDIYVNGAKYIAQ